MRSGTRPCAVQENVEKLKATAHELNPGAKVIVTDSVVTVDDADAIRGKKVVLVEDGPTLTHGGMPYGAGDYHPSVISCRVTTTTMHSPAWPSRQLSQAQLSGQRAKEQMRPHKRTHSCVHKAACAAPEACQAALNVAPVVSVAQKHCVALCTEGQG